MIVRLATDAMRTRFEIVLIGAAEPRLLAAGEEAIAEIEACEDRLSLFRPGSLLSVINREAAIRPVGVDRETFTLLCEARVLHALTEGAFDPTIAPLMKAWRLHADDSSAASAPSIDAARECVGMHHVELNETDHSVRFTRPGVSLDLGGLAKGHALMLAEAALRRVGIGSSGSDASLAEESALLHAGTSSVIAIGAPPGEPGWRIALADHEAVAADPSLPRASVLLRDRSLSVSSPHGRVVNDCGGVGARGGTLVHHIIDPRTGASSTGASFAAAVSRSAIEAEAVSTAMVVLNRRPFSLRDECVTVRLDNQSLSSGWHVEGASAAEVVYLSERFQVTPIDPKDPT